MICFPNAKINLGLNIVSKRNDGFHDIETVFYPIGLSDILEVIPSQETKILTSGIDIKTEPENNICFKAYQLVNKDYGLPPVEIVLHKLIPSGAGLGGGSADAAFLLKLLNSFFQLNLPNEKLHNYAMQLGSDCAFFIENKPAFAFGRGELLEKINLNLKNYFIYLVKPEISISTAEAYKAVVPKKPEQSLNELILRPVDDWKNLIFNDFEENVFKLYPAMREIKNQFYQHGAAYASMSGSGSSIYGLFREKPSPIGSFAPYFNWISAME
jgi:4-diphosphocytidyl-2-C-methyl-D-erythritol kinase